MPLIKRRFIDDSPNCNITSVTIYISKRFMQNKTSDMSNLLTASCSIRFQNYTVQRLDFKDLTAYTHTAQ